MAAGDAPRGVWGSSSPGTPRPRGQRAALGDEQDTGEVGQESPPAPGLGWKHGRAGREPWGEAETCKARSQRGQRNAGSRTPGAGTAPEQGQTPPFKGRVCVRHRQGGPRDTPPPPFPGHVEDSWGRERQIPPGAEGDTPWELGGLQCEGGTPQSREKGKGREGPALPGGAGDTWGQAATPSSRGRRSHPQPPSAPFPAGPAEPSAPAPLAPSLTVCARSGLRAAAAGGSAAGMDTAIMARDTAGPAPSGARSGAGAGQGPPRAPTAGSRPRQPGGPGGPGAARGGSRGGAAGSRSRDKGKGKREVSPSCLLAF